VKHIVNTIATSHSLLVKKKKNHIQKVGWQKKKKSLEILKKDISTSYLDEQLHKEEKGSLVEQSLRLHDNI
jgi:hypothetical protein